MAVILQFSTRIRRQLLVQLRKEEHLDHMVDIYSFYSANTIFYVAYVFFVIIWALEGHVKENQKINKGYLFEKKRKLCLNYLQSFVLKKKGCLRRTSRIILSAFPTVIASWSA